MAFYPCNNKYYNDSLSKMVLGYPVTTETHGYTNAPTLTVNLAEGTYYVTTDSHYNTSQNIYNATIYAEWANANNSSGTRQDKGYLLKANVGCYVQITGNEMQTDILIYKICFYYPITFSA